MKTFLCTNVHRRSCTSHTVHIHVSIPTIAAYVELFHYIYIRQWEGHTPTRLHVHHYPVHAHFTDHDVLKTLSNGSFSMHFLYMCHSSEDSSSCSGTQRSRSWLSQPVNCMRLYVGHMAGWSHCNGGILYLFFLWQLLKWTQRGFKA